jgi:hypothetical protein
MRWLVTTSTQFFATSASLFRYHARKQSSTMNCSGPKRRSSSATSSDNDSEYQTDGTSVEDDAEEATRSQPDRLSDDGISEDESVRPPEFYRAHASQVNNTKIPNIYAESTILQFDSVESQWRR